jgi:tripartite motif-containing protein 71
MTTFFQQLCDSGKPRLVLGFLVLCLCGLPQQSWGQPVTPLPVKYIGSFAGSGEGQGELLHPEAISVDMLGHLYIADTGNNRIQKFDATGQFLIERGGFGWEGEQLDRPVDICARGGLDIYVADEYNHRIVRFDRKLNFISAIRSDDTAAPGLEFEYPRGVTLTVDGDMFLIDGEQMRILKITGGSPAVTEFGGLGALSHPLREPRQIETDSRAYVYVSDSDAGLVRVFDVFGTFVRSLGETMQWEPTGLGLDAKSQLLVADARSRSIFMFAPDGRPVGTITGAAVPESFWGTPTDCTFHAGTYYILDGDTGMVHMFALQQP